MDLGWLMLVVQLCHFSGTNTAKAELACQKWMIDCIEKNEKERYPLTKCMKERKVE